MPYDGMMLVRWSDKPAPKVGRPHRDRAKNKAQRRARKRTR